MHDALQKENNYIPYPMSHVRHLAYQLCYSVLCMQLVFNTDFLEFYLKDTTLIAHTYVFARIAYSYA